MPKYYLARQPILDRELKLYGYELLFRDAQGRALSADTDDNAATADVLTTASEAGIERLAGGRNAFINLPERFLIDPELVPMHPEAVVLEVLETVTINDATVSGIRRLKERGFRMALDDFVFTTDKEPALREVDIIKIDVREIPPSRWEEEILRIKDAGCEVLAEKVETQAEHDQLMDLGCDYFQGFFFARPQLVSGSRLSSNRIALLQLMAQVNDPATGIDELADLVSRDVALSVRTLNYVNSAGSGLNRRIDSVREAIVYVGRRVIRNWVTLFMMTRVDGKPDALLALALTRARFCELLAEARAHDDSGSFFTLGLLSILDSLMDAPMEKVLEQMAISEEMHAALTDGAGVGGDALRLARTLERGEIPGDIPDLPGDDTLADLHLAAMAWSDDALAGVSA